MHLPAASVHYVGLGCVVLAAAAMLGVVTVSSQPAGDDQWMRCPNGDPEPGTVDARCVAEGQYVHKGDVLADFTTPAERAAVRRAELDLHLWVLEDPEYAFDVLRDVTAVIQRDRMVIFADEDGVVGKLRGVRPLSYAGEPCVILVLSAR